MFLHLHILAIDMLVWTQSLALNFNTSVFGSFSSLQCRKCGRQGGVIRSILPQDKAMIPGFSLKRGAEVERRATFCQLNYYYSCARTL